MICLFAANIISTATSNIQSCLCSPEVEKFREYITIDTSPGQNLSQYAILFSQHTILILKYVNIKTQKELKTHISRYFFVLKWQTSKRLQIFAIADALHPRSTCVKGRSKGGYFLIPLSYNFFIRMQRSGLQLDIGHTGFNRNTDLLQLLTYLLCGGGISLIEPASCYCSTIFKYFILGPAVDFWRRLAEEQGIEIKVYECVPGYPLIVLKWPGNDPSLSSVLLLSHMDVEPANYKVYAF